MKNLKTIPEFKNQEEEFEFWNNNDSADFVDWNTAKEVNFTNLKKTNKEITLSIPVDIFEKIKINANKIDIPYNSLIKLYLIQGLENNYSYKNI